MIPHFSSLSQWRKIQDYSDHTRVVENEKDKISEGKDYCHPGVLLDALTMHEVSRHKHTSFVAHLAFRRWSFSGHRYA